MLYFIVWEIYGSNWVLQGKGSDFLRVESNEDVDTKVLSTQDALAKGNGVKREQCVITTLQPVSKLD